MIESKEELPTVKAKGEYIHHNKFIIRIPFTQIGWKKPWKNKLETKELLDKAPLMFYMREDGEVDTYFNTKNGIFKPRDKWGREKGYENIIETRKLRYWNYGGQRIPVYFHFEKELYGYPHEPKIDAEAITKTLRSIQLDYRSYDNTGSFWDFLDNKEGIKNLIYLLGGFVAVVLGAMWIWNTFDLITVFKGGEEVIKTVVPQVVNTSIPPPILN